MNKDLGDYIYSQSTPSFKTELEDTAVPTSSTQWQIQISQQKLKDISDSLISLTVEVEKLRELIIAHTSNMAIQINDLNSR